MDAQSEEEENNLSDKISAEINDFGTAALALIKRLNAQKKVGTFFPALLAALIAAILVGGGMFLLPALQNEFEFPVSLPHTTEIPSVELLHQHALELRCTELEDGTLEVIIAGRSPSNVQTSGIGIRGLFKNAPKEED